MKSLLAEEMKVEETNISHTNCTNENDAQRERERKDVKKIKTCLCGYAHIDKLFICLHCSHADHLTQSPRKLNKRNDNNSNAD